jgi:hypothetical protein
MTSDCLDRCLRLLGASTRRCRSVLAQGGSLIPRRSPPRSPGWSSQTRRERLRKQPASDQVEVRQPKHRLRPGEVLGQPPMDGPTGQQSLRIVPLEQR